MIISYPTRTYNVKLTISQYLTKDTKIIQKSLVKISFQVFTYNLDRSTDFKSSFFFEYV